MELKDILEALNHYGIGGTLIGCLILALWLLVKSTWFTNLMTKVSDKVMERFMKKKTSDEPKVQIIDEVDILNHDIFNYIDFWMYSKVPTFQFSTEYRTVVFRMYLTIFLKKHKENIRNYVDKKEFEKMGEAAIKGAEAIGYEGAGTIEFLVDKHGKFYFMEMNTRIQVEHPITEEVTDFDLIKEQIKVAAGVPISGKNYFPKLYAMECRINAEDPKNNFRPSPGKITNLHFPGGHGVRIDSHVYAGYTIPSNYDSMIAKLIVTGQSRAEVLTRMKRALQEFVIEGIKTTIPFHIKLMDDEIFKSGLFTTAFLDTFDFSDL
jgi:hypothetical protein